MRQQHLITGSSLLVNKSLKPSSQNNLGLMRRTIYKLDRMAKDIINQNQITWRDNPSVLMN